MGYFELVYRPHVCDITVDNTRISQYTYFRLLYILYAEGQVKVIVVCINKNDE